MKNQMIESFFNFLSSLSDNPSLLINVMFFLFGFVALILMYKLAKQNIKSRKKE